MILRPTLAACAALFLLPAGPASASPCSDRIAALEGRLAEAARTTGAISSGGQGVAAARESRAMENRDGGATITAPSVPPFQDQAREAETTRRAAREVDGGDAVMGARAEMNGARALEAKGDHAACLDMIGRAERRLEAR